VTLEEASDGRVNVLINRENQQILDNPHCKVVISQGNWEKTLQIDIMASISPKLTIDRPAGPADLPVNALLTCEPPWDIDDDMADNNASLILKTQTSFVQVDSDLLYGAGATILVVGVLYLLGLLRPTSAAEKSRTARRSQKSSGVESRRKKPAAVSQVEDIAPDYDSEIHLEGVDSEGGGGAGRSGDAARKEEESVVEDLSNMQESLIEVEEPTVVDEPPEEELDEFERRLRDLRLRRQNRE
jgi:hypothetical protein